MLPDARQLQSAAAAASAAEPGTFHLFSHGRPGQLLINGQWLGAPEIAAWLRDIGLPEGTEYLNLYGCEFAQGEEGAQAVNTLEQLLGVRVAASTNLTGQGGDWVLEVGAPTVALRVEDYAHSLQCASGTNCDGDAYLNTPDADDDNDGILDVNECSAGTFALTDASVQAIPDAGANSSTLRTTIGGTVVFTSTQPHYDNYLFPTQFPNNALIFPNVNWGLPNTSWTSGNIVTFTFPTPITRFQVIGYDFDLTSGGSFEYLTNFSVNPTTLSPNIVIDAGRYRSNAGNQTLTFTWNLGTPITSISFETGRLSNGLSIGFTVLIDGCVKDTDLDGFLDLFDNDSDADGCADAIEGGANFTAANIDANRRLTGTVQANGVPTVAGAGQTVGDSLVATRVLLNGTNPVNQNITTVPSAASFTISITATNTTVFSAGTPQYGSGTSANASTVYRWYLGNPDAGGTPLTNTGVYSGTTTATLGISNVNNLIGNTYYVVVTQTNHTCTRIVRSAQLLSTVVDLAITKTNTPASGVSDLPNDTVTRGQSTTYQIVVTNNGPQSVTGARVTDSATGLTCTGLTCVSSPALPSACPATAPTAAQLLGTGVTLQTLPVGGTVSMNLSCTVN